MLFLGGTRGRTSAHHTAGQGGFHAFPASQMFFLRLLPQLPILAAMDLRMDQAFRSAQAATVLVHMWVFDGCRQRYYQQVCIVLTKLLHRHQVPAYLNQPVGLAPRCHRNPLGYPSTTRDRNVTLIASRTHNDILD